MAEQRTRTDRREREDGPPQGCCERRKRVERRLPVAQEMELSADDFSQLFGSVAKLGNVDAQFDLSAQVFDRLNER